MNNLQACRLVADAQSTAGLGGNKRTTLWQQTLAGLIPRAGLAVAGLGSVGPGGFDYIDSQVK